MSKGNNRKRLNIRKSGLRQFNEQEMIREKVENDLIGKKAIDNFSREYSKIIQKYNKRNQKDAYIIRFIHEPKAFFVTFQTYKDRDTGKWEACKYFDSIHHPTIGLNDYSKARRKRIPEFDKYRDTEKIPIEEVMKLGANYSCGLCGNHSFKYSDIKKNICFVVQDEGNMNPFTNGIVICNDCRRKYFL